MPQPEGGTILRGAIADQDTLLALFQRLEHQGLIVLAVQLAEGFDAEMPAAHRRAEELDLL